MHNLNPAAVPDPDWLALPAGVLRHIFGRASTWQVPGACLAAAVCRTWRTAAAGCRDIRLLYFSSEGARDASFVAWLRRNSPQLGALTIKSYTGGCTYDCVVLQALAEVAQAACAAGAPLPLHTLRMPGASATLDVTSRLLANLPKLRAMQPAIHFRWEETRHGEVNKLLEVLEVLPDLSHLAQLTFLHLRDWRTDASMSTKLPPGVRELQLPYVRLPPEVLLEQEEVITAVLHDDDDDVLLQLSQLKHLKQVSLNIQQMTPAVRAALAQHTALSTLELFDRREYVPDEHVQAALPAAASIRSLRHLEIGLRWPLAPPAAALSALTGLTRLSLSMFVFIDSSSIEQRHAWADGIGRLPGLQQLTVPAVLVEAGRTWLVGLQQLRVLVLECRHVPDPNTGSMPWLEACTQEVLPPRLQVLGVEGCCNAEQAASWHIRRRLQQRLASSGCDVVVGGYLDCWPDPALQLAGLPTGLQQALG